MNKLNKKRVSLLFFILSIIYILLYLRPTVIDFDETYTLELIHHSFNKIIYFDSMDVHPPLYYFLLKIFVNAFTFWTSSLSVEIIVARLFSVATSVIMFIYLRKITLTLHIYHNICIQWALFILLPNVLGAKFSLQQFTNIRMYSLAAMFIVIEIYYLLKFSRVNKTLFLILATIFAILASYTHYYSAIFGGLLILINFIYFCFKNKKKSFKVFFAGVFFGFSFIPWIRVFIHQSTNSSTYWMSYITEFKEIFEFLTIICIFIYPIYIYIIKNKNKQVIDELNVILSVIGISFVLTISYSFLVKPIFQFRYMFPILIVYEFLGINVIITWIDDKKLLIPVIVIILMLIASIGSTINQISYDKNSIKLVNIYDDWKYNRHKIIYIRKNGTYYENNNYTAFIGSINKRFIVPNSFKRSSHIYFNNAYKKTFYKYIINKIN